MKGSCHGYFAAVRLDTDKIMFFVFSILSWKWRNTLTSFLHSLTSGIWAPLVFYLDPTLADDMIKGYTGSAHTLVCFSIGYFVYDFLDMFLYTWHKRSTKAR